MEWHRTYLIHIMSLGSSVCYIVVFVKTLRVFRHFQKKLLRYFETTNRVLELRFMLILHSRLTRRFHPYQKQPHGCLHRCLFPTFLRLKQNIYTIETYPITPTCIWCLVNYAHALHVNHRPCVVKRSKSACYLKCVCNAMCFREKRKTQNPETLE